jgi:hypothetical protein
LRDRTTVRAADQISGGLDRLLDLAVIVRHCEHDEPGHAQITHRVETDLPYLACVLGGRAARHLFLPCNNFDGIDQQGLLAFPRRDTLGE